MIGCFGRHPRFAAAALLLAAGVLAGGAPAGEPAGGGGSAAARHILESTPLRKGLCLDIGCGDGRLAAEIARGSQYRIECLDSDEKSVAEARRTLSAAGLYGTRAAATRADLSATGLPSDCARLVICGDEFVRGRAGRDFKEVLRVLSPYGVAVLGQGAAAARSGQALTRAELEGWLTEAGIKSFEVTEGKDGVWAKVRKERPKGWDEWPQRCHDASNTFGSNDDASGSPLCIQWAQSCPPALGSSSVLLAGGRYFVLSPEHRQWPATSPAIRAYDAFSGVELWARVSREAVGLDRALKHYGPEKSCMDIIATERKLYVLGGPVCGVLDPETGETLQQMAIPAEAGADKSDIWQYISLEGGLLYGAIGPSPMYKGAWWGMTPRGTARSVFALDPESGRVVWEGKLPARVNSLVLGGGKLFYFDEGFALHALDAKTGKESWSKKGFDFPKGSNVVVAAFCEDRIWVSYYQGNNFLNKCKLVVLSAADGQLVAEPKFPGVTSALTLAGGKAYATPQHAEGGCMAYEAKTGKELGEIQAKIGERQTTRIGGKCTPAIATPHLLCGRISACSGVLDLASGKAVVFQSTRPTCFLPPVPSYARYYLLAPSCNCAYLFRSHLALGAGKPSAPAAGERVVKGPAFGRPAAAAAPGKDDWPTWRAEVARGGRTAQAAALPLKQLWEKKFAGEGLTPLAVAGGLVFVGSDAHRFRALDAADGKDRWDVPAEGRVLSAPFAANGCVYFSDDAGWAHCLEAAGGQEVWRFRAALAGDRIIAAGKPMSRWPSGCGVLIDGKTAYFTAGFMPEEGVALYAVDALTGQTQWEQFFPLGKLAAAGKLALGNDRLYIPSERGPATAVSLKDSKHALIADWPWVCGTDLMAVGGDMVAQTPVFEYVWRTEARSRGGVLPLVTEDTVYLRNGQLLTAEKRALFAVASARLSIRDEGGRKSTAPEPPPLWTAWKDAPMTAAIMAGDAIFTGGEGKVYATAAAGGKELWSAPVPGTVRDLAFAGGRLYAVCGDGSVVCFGKQ